MLAKTGNLIEQKFSEYIVGEVPGMNAIKIVTPDHCERSEEIHKVIAFMSSGGRHYTGALEATYRHIEENESSLIFDVVQALNQEVLTTVAKTTSTTMRRIVIRISPVGVDTSNPGQIAAIVNGLKTHLQTEVKKN